MPVKEIRSVLVYGADPFSPPGLSEDKCLSVCIYAEIEVDNSEGYRKVGYVTIYSCIVRHRTVEKTLFCKLWEPPSESKFLGRCLCSLCDLEWFPRGWSCTWLQ